MIGSVARREKQMTIALRIFWCLALYSAAAGALDVRLPGDVIPEHYRIKMIPVLEDEDFRIFGSVKINVLVKQPTQRIVLHGKGITVSDPVSVTGIVPEDGGIKVTNVGYDDEREFIILDLNKPLVKDGKYQVAMNYKAALDDKLEGFYRSSYVDRTSQQKIWLAVTQMEPTDARRAFPCFDEPAMKATFEVILGRRESMSSLSNMPLRKTEPMRFNPGWVWDYFEKSVPMSTYLVACLVSDFDFRTGAPLVRSPAPAEGNPQDRLVASSTEVRIWARRDVIDTTQLAVDVTTKMLSFLETYFKVAFPLPKIDLVAVPDFSAGAMENWGLVTFRERTLLYNSTEAVARDKSNVLSVIAHELAHQWFGNLVTMQWWNDLWLNEGFAAYVEDLVMEQVAPEFDIHVGSILELQRVQGPDALESTHPISVEVEHPDQISEIFDEISYLKGAAVIRMMHNFLGDETFRQGLANYLITLKYKNARQDDLWNFLTEQAHSDGALPPNVDVKTIMDSWTLQKGYPVVTMTRNYQDGTVMINQTRFLRTAANSSLLDTLSASIEVPSEAEEQETPRGPSSSYQWWIPVSITDASAADFRANNTRPQVWLSPDALSVQTGTSANPDSWIVANVRVTGYFRVNYDDRNWELLSQQLLRNHQVIHAANRAQLIDDAFALAAAGIVPYTRPLNLVEYLSRENHYVPWSSALQSLGYIRNMFMFTPHMGRWNAYMESLVIPAFQRLSFDISPSDGPLDILAKVTLSGQACAVGYKPCVKRAQQLFERLMQSHDPSSDLTIAPDMRSTVYCNAIRYGGLAEWDFGWRMAQNVSTPQHRDVLLSSLSCSRDPWILIRYLSWILDESSGVRRQDGRSIVSSIARNPVGRPLAFQFLKDNWDALVQYFGRVTTPMSMMSAVTSSFNTPAELNEMGSFLSRRSADLATSKSSVQRLVTTVAANIHWMETNFKTLLQWLEKRNL